MQNDVPQALSHWRPDSWQRKPVTQQPNYPDAAALNAVLGQLSRLPPLVTSWEIESAETPARRRPSRASMFLLQGGDCSESFEDCESGAIAAS